MSALHCMFLRFLIWQAQYDLALLRRQIKHSNACLEHDTSRLHALQLELMRTQSETQT